MCVCGCSGACIVALGEKIAGLYSPDSSLREEIESAAKRTDEGIDNYDELAIPPLSIL